MPDRETDTRRFSPADPAVALVLLTRLPLPHLPDTWLARGARAAWAYPLVGVVIGGLASAVGIAALALGLPAMLAAGLALAVQIMATGALHEDGLADCADGFWGGWEPARRLEIMKDSRIGSYGVLALVLATGLRWGAWAALLPLGIGGVIAAAVLSRATMPALMAALPHARPGGLSAQVGRPEGITAGVAGALAGALALIWLGWAALPVALATAAAAAAWTALARARIGGQTGDVLGAAQQVSELAALLVLVALTT